ncbi:PLP-dependent aminotransferase family protein [Kribbella sp. CA-253562]|uniref:MocR-like pyridoxine biosynthesis transcription factor PdxR n=1 Tax=Kribbella sp. CA-253562 TaxID=3239942 RepID=UPI003D8C4562
MRVAHVVRVPIAVDRDSNQPLCRQIVDQLKSAIEAGTLSAGSELPSSRALAQMLQVSRTVTVTAYTELFALDYLRAEPGAGTFVADAVRKPNGHSKPESIRRRHTIDFSPGRPNTEAFPVAAWRSAWQRASYAPPSGTHAPPLGLSFLREQVAAHLTRTRGLGCQPDQIVITNGLFHGMDLLAQLMADSGKPAVIEDPTHPLVHSILNARGITTFPVPVDHHGARIDRLPDGAGLAVVTPSHQFPLAGSMPLARRHALLAWAARNNTVLVELDMANDLHGHDAFLPCLWSLRSNDSVVHLGTFEHLFSPDLPLGYLVLPGRLVQAAEAQIALTKAHPSTLAQRAAQELFTSGEVARYTNRLHRSYQQKRRIVEEALHPASAMRLSGLAGSHVAVHLECDVSAESISGELARRSIIAPAAAKYFHTGTCDSNALILGFGHLTNSDLKRGLAAIKDSVCSRPC